MASPRAFICSVVSTGRTTGWVAELASSAMARSRPPPTMRSRQSGCRWSMALAPIQVAKLSLSQRSFHQLMVTRSPNHWCAISWAMVPATSWRSSWVESLGSISRSRSK